MFEMLDIIVNELIINPLSAYDIEGKINKYIYVSGALEPTRRFFQFKNYEPEALETAVLKVANREMSQRHASRVYGVPQPTISKRIRMMRAKAECQKMELQMVADAEKEAVGRSENDKSETRGGNYGERDKND